MRDRNKQERNGGERIKEDWKGSGRDRNKEELNERDRNKEERNWREWIEEEWSGTERERNKE